jgi:hypothetical protein
MSSKLSGILRIAGRGAGYSDLGGYGVAGFVGILW